MRRYVASLMRGEGDVDDVVQEIFLLVVRKIKTLRDPSLFRPWLFRIASRQTFRAMREEREWNRLAADDHESQNLESIAEEPAVSEIEPLIGKLSIASRAVIAMRYIEGLKQEEIAAALGISVGTVKSRIAYGLTQLRKAMAA